MLEKRFHYTTLHRHKQTIGDRRKEKLVLVILGWKEKGLASKYLLMLVRLETPPTPDRWSMLGISRGNKLSWAQVCVSSKHGSYD